MADRVRFIMENMALNFRQLAELKLFTDEEIKVTVKKRTDFEYLLRRRQLEPSDFQRYLEFEINLERLRTIREESSAKSRSKDHIALYRTVKAASIRHISYIFDRAIRRFPSNMSFWADYIAFLQLKKANAMLNTLYGKALSLHPSNVHFWLQASIHELKSNGNSHAARILLQRGLRTNKNSSELWLRYFDLELWNALRLIERKKILDIGEVEEGADLIEAAPLVVFKHAIKCLSHHTDTHAQEIHPAILQMHLASEGFVNRLSLAMEKLLKKKFSRTIGFWKHILRVQLRRALSQSLEKDAPGMRVRSTPLEVLTAVTLAMNNYVSIIRDANTIFLSSDVWVQWVQAALNLLLETICECMSALTDAATYYEHPISTSSEILVDTRPMKKSRRSVEPAISKPNQEEEQVMESFRSKCSASVDGIRLLMTELVQSHCAHAQSGALYHGKLIAATATVKDEAALEPPLAVVIEFHFSLLSLMLSSERLSISDMNNHFTSDEANLLSDRVGSLVAWVQKSALKVSPAPVATEKFSAVDSEKNFVIDWCKAAKVCLTSFQRQQISDPTSEKIDSLLQQFLASLSPIALTLATSKEGVSLLLDAVHAAGSSESCCDAGSTILETIINGKPCTQSMMVVAGSKSGDSSSDHSIAQDASKEDKILTKGEWCKVYLRYLNSCTWIEDAVDTDPFVEGYNNILQSIRSKPHYFTVSDLEEFYSFVIVVLKAQLAVSSRRDSSSSSIVSRFIEKKAATGSSNLDSSRSIAAFALRVAEEAVKVCPSVASFWTHLIELHESNGDYTAAEAVQWRSKRIL